MTGANRRTFLASAGAGAAALALSRPARAVGANDQIRLAVIGIRSRGQEHINAFSKRKDTPIVALCDIDSRLFDASSKKVEDRSGKAPLLVTDLRRIMDDKSIDAVTIATPNHWHALAAVWACQAGKDVYVEKPVSHNVSEGRKIAEAAKKYNKIVQAGTQNRSIAGVRQAMEFLHSGGLGPVYLAKGLCYKPRASIGVKADAAIPEGVDYNIWLGPAPERHFNPNRFHYEWHWNWDYGNGDIGNQGIHQMDIARWGLGKDVHPKHIVASGGRYGYKDDGQTPNTQIAAFNYDDCMLEFEVRGLPTNPEQGIKVGNLFYGPKGMMVIDGDKWATFMGHKNEPGPKGSGNGDHFGNFVEAVKSRKPETLHAEVTEGHMSSALCHPANISYHLGRALNFDSKEEKFVSDPEADAMLTRNTGRRSQCRKRCDCVEHGGSRRPQRGRPRHIRPGPKDRRRCSRLHPSNACPTSKVGSAIADFFDSEEKKSAIADPTKKRRGSARARRACGCGHELHGRGLRLAPSLAAPSSTFRRASA